MVDAGGVDIAPSAQPIADLPDGRHDGDALHPTRQPAGALRALIDSFCPEGGTVPDPFRRSGSTLVAAGETDRSWIGIELDPFHHATAERRLARHAAIAA